VPVVFVHGVATRASASERDGIDFRNAMMRRYIFPPLGLDPAGVVMFDPYWGGYAAKFRWNHASLPTGRHEAFGAVEALPTLLLAELGVGPDHDRVLLDVARHSLENAVDLIWATAGELTTDPVEAEVLAAAAGRATALARQPAPPRWIEDARDDQELLYYLAAELDETEITGAVPGREAFGGEQVWDRLREAGGRIRDTASRLAGRAFVGAFRSWLNEFASVFLGDVFVYLDKRGDRGAEGPIVATIASDLEEAAGKRTAADPNLVVIAHSMGGNIVYDVLSYYRPDLRVETLVTVGSQVGLFGELGLFRSSQPDFPVNPITDRVAPLPNVGRWINVFDINDMLGFAAAAIFAGVEDYAYGTGKGVFKAHGAYFLRPSFYGRLAARLDAGSHDLR
jgi:hypothetical protein